MSKPVYIDELAARHFYDSGMSDNQIAEALGVQKHNIGNWRRRNGLVSATTKRKMHEDAKRMPGLVSDAINADDLGISYGEYKSRQRRGEIL